jgi:hypothetical protein
MQLQFEDFGMIFALLSPCYIVAWNNIQLTTSINLRLSKLEEAHKIIHNGACNNGNI